MRRKERIRIWAEGRNAQRAGESYHKSPYAEESPERNQWLNGWWARYYEEEIKP